MASLSTKPKWFRCLLGNRAHHTLTTTRNAPDSVALLLAASGGPRWLGLIGIDQSLRAFLSQRTTSPLPVLGASSGAWRMAAFCADDDGQAYEQLIEEYIEQRFEGRPTTEQITEVCQAYLERLFSPERVRSILTHQRFQLNFTTALLPRERPTKNTQIGSLLLTALLNAVDRQLIGSIFKRAIFTTLPSSQCSPFADGWDTIPTHRVALSEDNLVRALLASGSIPTVLTGESAIPGSPPGHHLDGGLIDYHFEIETGGPIVYPHFSDDPIPGWMDRFFPKRRISKQARRDLCLIVPSDELVLRYPHGRFPGRQDFMDSSNDERIRDWRAAARLSRQIEKELTLCLECGELALVSEPLN